MRCPRCGAPLTDTDGTLVCRDGGMELSPNARRALTTWSMDPAAVAGTPSTVRWGGRWHCPVDGLRMQEAEGQVSCPGCGRHLPPRLMYALVEFHQHTLVNQDGG